VTAPTAGLPAGRRASAARHEAGGTARRPGWPAGVGGTVAALVAVACAVAVAIVDDGVVRAATALVTVTFATVAAVGIDAALAAWRRVARPGGDVTGAGGRGDGVVARVLVVAGRPDRSPSGWWAATSAAARPWPYVVPLLAGVLAPGALLAGAVMALSIGWRIESVGAFVGTLVGAAPPDGPAAVAVSLAGWLVLIVVAAAVAVTAAWALPASPSRPAPRRPRLLGATVRPGDDGFPAVAGANFAVGLRALAVGAVVVALAVGAVPDPLVDVVRTQPVLAAVLAAVLVFIAAPGVEAAGPVGLVLAPFGTAAVVAAVVVCLVLDRHGAAALARTAGTRVAAWATVVVVGPTVAVASVVGVVVS
jgi:hypothetical protein